jgi:tetratricopeptide (TPR) repeat protein
MKKLISIITLAVLCLIPIAALASNTDRAMGHVQIGEYDQAAWLIQGELEKNPGNGQLRLILGNIYALQGQTEKSDQEYRKAVKADPSLSSEVGNAYREATLFFLQYGQIKQAQLSAMKFASLKPKKQGAFGEELYRKGKKLLNGQNYGPEWGYFSVAGELNFLTKEKAANDYLEIGNKVSDSQCLYFYSKAKELVGYPDPNAEKRVIGYANSIAGFKDRESEFNQYKASLAEFLGSEKIKQYFPEYKTIYPGQKEVIKLMPGQRTTYKINFSVGQLSCDISSHNDHFIMHFSDGTSYEAWNMKTWPQKTNPEITLEAANEEQVIIVYRK